MTEDVFLRQARHGDAGAFAALVQQSSGGLYRFVRARLRDDGAAADAAQEAFLRAWRAIASFRGECSFRSWLYRIAQRLIIDERTRRGRAPVAGLDFDEADPAAPEPTAGLEAEAERQDVRAALERIAPDERELIRLVYYDGLSYKEISALRGLPLGTVKVRLHRARARLRVQLEEMWEVHPA